MWTFSDAPTHATEPTRQDRMRRDFLDRLIESDSQDAGPMSAPPAPSRRPSEPRDLPARHSATGAPRRRDYLQAASEAPDTWATRLQVRLLQQLAQRFDQVRPLLPQLLRTAGTGLALGLAAFIAALGLLVVLQDDRTVSDATQLNAAVPAAGTNGIARIAPAAPQGAPRIHTAAKSRSQPIAPAVFTLVMPSGATSTAALPFQPVFETAEEAFGMVVVRNVPLGVTFNRGTVTAPGVWMMSAAALTEAQLTAYPIAPQQFLLHVDVTDQAGVIYAVFTLDVARSVATPATRG
jgi:hypothetical protein